MIKMNEMYKCQEIRYDRAAAEEKAKQLLKQIRSLFAINKITRKSSYKVGHTGKPDTKAKKMTEKLLAIELL